MKQRVSPGFYNSEMETKYFFLYLSSKKLLRQKSSAADYTQKLTKFEVAYYKVSKMNKILNEISKNENEFIKYLEPSWFKQKVDTNAERLGIKPYSELNKNEDDFILL